MADPDFQIRGGGGGAVSKEFFRASVWSKNKGGHPLDPPGFLRRGGNLQSFHYRTANDFTLSFQSVGEFL